MADRKPTPNILDDLMSAAPAGTAKPAASSLRIEEIRRDGGTQPRAGLDQGHVQDLIAALVAGDELPPVDVYFDGNAYWLYDGYHRVDAHSRLGKYTIQAIIHQGTQVDAQWASYSVNRGHGLKRTNEDKKRAVLASLRHANAASLSNVQIAKHVGVDEGTIRHYRAHMEATSEIPKSTARTGTDGRTINTANIGASRPAPQRDDAAEDAWRPPGVGARMMYHETPSAVKPADDAERAAVAVAADDSNAQTSRNTQLLHILDALIEAMPELGGQIGQQEYCSSLVITLNMLRNSLLRVIAAPAPPPAAPAAPATELPADLVAHGWELRQARNGGGRWYAAITVEGEEQEIATVKRGTIADVIGDCRYMEKNLSIGVVI